MATYTIYTLGASQISISGGAVLSGFTQGDGSHLQGETITLNSNAWETVDIEDDDANFNDSENGQVLDGAQTYDGTNYANGLRVEAEYTLTVQDPDGNTYEIIGFNINEGGGGQSYGTVEGLAFIGPVAGFPPVGVPLTVVGTAEGPSGSSTPYSSYATPPCFTAGTLIETKEALVPIEKLVVGDLVRTLDDDFQPIRWIGRTTIAARDLEQQPRLRPILIPTGAFGSGLPARPMAVSPMHRIMRESAVGELLFGEGEVLVAAKYLLGKYGVETAHGSENVTYIHLCFDRHQIVQSDGVWTESFLPGEQALSGLCAQQKDELRNIFGVKSLGEIAASTARMCLKRHEADALLAA